MADSTMRNCFTERQLRNSGIGKLILFEWHSVSIGVLGICRMKLVKSNAIAITPGTSVAGVE